MCGIAGILGWNGRFGDRELLQSMIAALAHRGPDDQGIQLSGPVGLAHARLSIIDLVGGRQPMANEDGTIWLVHNGEIYNHVELREELVARGHEFSTRSDSEVILHLYEDEGEDLVRRLNGQWAFALWDSRRGVLLLSRDRAGIRPLFYTKTGDALVFASEIKSLLRHPGVVAEPDPVALDQIFTFWSALPPRTFFRGIHALPPGHSMTVKGKDVRIRPHWSVDPGRAEPSADRLLELLRDATRLRLRSDVPVGVYLSGGLDSTATTAIAKSESDALKHSFSVSFEDEAFDERPYQQLAAAELGTSHHEVRVSHADICAAFPDAVRHMETPVLRTAPVPLYLLARAVREHGYKVVVTGEGADEILGGYDLFKEAKVRRFCAAQPASRLRPLLLKRLYPYMPEMQRQSVGYLKAFFSAGGDVDDPFFSHLPRWRTTSMAKVFFSDDLRAEIGGYDAVDELRASLPRPYGGWDYFTRAQFLEFSVLMPGYILASQGDRMSMAHSVEGRFPFLDHRVVEYAFSLPPRAKMRGLDEKHLLKRAVRELVPEPIARRHKQPFRAPDARSFYDGGGARAEYVARLLSPASLRNFNLFDADRVGALVRKVQSDRPIGAKDNMALVGVLSTQLLMEQIDAQAG